MIIYVVTSGEQYEGGRILGAFEDAADAFYLCESERRNVQLDWHRSGKWDGPRSWTWAHPDLFHKWMMACVMGSGPYHYAHWWKIEAVEVAEQASSLFVPLRFSEEGARFIVDLILKPPPANAKLRALFWGKGT